MSPDTKLKFLVVDDEPLQLELLRGLVAAMPWLVDIVACSDGREAIEYLDNINNDPMPDLVITDYYMPDVDGLGLLSHIKSDERLKEIPVLMVSVFDRPELQEKAMALGVDDFLERPLNKHMVLARCRGLLHVSRSMKEPMAHNVDLPGTAGSDNTILINEGQLHLLYKRGVVKDVLVREVKEDKLQFELIILFFNSSDIGLVITTRNKPRRWRNLNLLPEFLRRICPSIKQAVIVLDDCEQ